MFGFHTGEHCAFHASLRRYHEPDEVKIAIVPQLLNGRATDRLLRPALTAQLAEVLAGARRRSTVKQESVRQVSKRV